MRWAGLSVLGGVKCVGLGAKTNVLFAAALLCRFADSKGFQVELVALMSGGVKGSWGRCSWRRAVRLKARPGIAIGVALDEFTPSLVEVKGFGVGRQFKMASVEIGSPMWYSSVMEFFLISK